MLIGSTNELAKKREKTGFSLKSSNVVSRMHRKFLISANIRIGATGKGSFSWGKYLDKTLLSFLVPSRFDFLGDRRLGGQETFGRICISKKSFLKN